MRQVLVGLAVFFASPTIFALELSCPLAISTAQSLSVQPSSAPLKGWQEFIRPAESAEATSLSRFYRIDLYAGNPQQIAQLKPDDDRAAHPRWSFDKPAAADTPIYMACVYQNTRIELIKALPLNVKQCTAIAGVLHCKQFNPVRASSKNGDINQ